MNSAGETMPRSECRQRSSDQHAVSVEDVDAADIRQRAELGLEHQVDVRAGHPAFVMLDRIDPARLHVRDQVFLNGAQVLELLVEVARQQQHRVFQLALGVVERALAEIADHHHGPDRDGRDQQHAAENQPADRIVAHGSFDVEGGGTVCRHRS
jgi:hypothetical protein